MSKGKNTDAVSSAGCCAFHRKSLSCSWVLHTKSFTTGNCKCYTYFQSWDKASGWTSNPQFHTKSTHTKDARVTAFYSFNIQWKWMLDSPAGFLRRCSKSVAWMHLGRSGTSKLTCYWWVFNRSHVVLIWFFQNPSGKQQEVTTQISVVLLVALCIS